MDGMFWVLLGLVSLFIGSAILYNSSARRFAANWYFNYLDSQVEREKRVLTMQAPIFILVGLLFVLLPFATPPEPQSLILDQRCEWYREFLKEAKDMTLEELGAAGDKLTMDAGSSGKAWAKFSAYFREYNERRGMHDSTEWDECLK